MRGLQISGIAVDVCHGFDGPVLCSFEIKLIEFMCFIFDEAQKPFSNTM